MKIKEDDFILGKIHILERNLRELAQKFENHENQRELGVTQ